MDEALVTAIQHDPDDLESYRVLADALQAAGDPRGDLMALQLARESARTPGEARQLDDAIGRQFAAHGPAILGPLRRWADAALFSPHWAWRRGCLDRVSSDDPALLAAVFAHPAGRMVRDLSAAGTDALAIVAREAPPSVRALMLATADAAPVGEVVRRFPHLACLACVRCVPGLDEVHVVEARLVETSVGALRARWPALVRLTVEIARGVPAQSDVIMDMLGSPRFPALASLAFPGCPFAHGFVLMLANSRVGRQLEELDLTGGSLDDAAAQAWAARPRAHKLKRLRVRDNRLSYVGIEALAQVAERVIVRQRDEVA